MSFAALDAEPGPHSREQMIEALGGHLCRCTGYLNIVAAGELALVDDGARA
jgi:xanthine dehydrogenase iron-sulfur cluster and FAD-binding subunit A